MKRLVFSSLLIVPLCALATDAPDASFYRHAAQGGMAEVELANLALKKSEDPAVKDFAARMVKDHTAANDKLRSVAASKNVTLPSHESVNEAATKAKLEVLSGSTFDKAYIKDMVKDHEKDVAEFRREAKSGQDPDARAYASETLPTLKEHLAKIRSIADKSGLTASR